MKFVKTVSRLGINTILVCVLTFSFSWLFGHISFSDDTIAVLDRLAGWFGIHGAEDVDDLYINVTMSISLVTAILLVWLVNRVIN